MIKFADTESNGSVDLFHVHECNTINILRLHVRVVKQNVYGIYVCDKKSFWTCRP